MRKGLVVLLAAVVVAMFAVSAMADFSTSGFVRVKGRVEQNYIAGSSGGSFILPAKDAPTAAYAEERARIKLDWKNENASAGATAFFEIDFQNFGDGSYVVARNTGAGLEGDSINLETKNLYLWFNVPDTSVRVQAGLQNQTDSFGGMIFGYADMAGVFVTGKAEPVGYRLGWSKFTQTSRTGDVGVDLYVAEVKFAPVKEAKLGLDFYAIRDAAGNTSATSIGGPLQSTLRLTEDLTGVRAGLRYDPSVFYFIGVDGAFDAGVAKLSGYAFYNKGKIEKAQFGAETAVNAAGTSTFSYVGSPQEDIDVKAWAADLRADLNLGPGKAFLEAAYVSGTSDTDTDFKSPITASNYALAGSFPLTSMDTQILFPNLDDINASSALAYDVQNKGRGIIAVAAGFTMKLSDALSGKVGAGYLADAKNTVGSPVKKHKATEVNANVNYQVSKGMDIGLYGAYAFLSDWESYQTVTLPDPPFSQTGGVKRTVANTTADADDIYKLYVRMNYAF